MKMEPTAAKNKAAWGKARRIVIGIILTVGVGWTLNKSVTAANLRSEPAGFWRGVLHGALMPGSWPYLAVGKEVVIYADNNNGRFYKLGYTSGVNGSGLLFFGIFFWRVNRLRKRYVTAA